LMRSQRASLSAYLLVMPLHTPSTASLSSPVGID
jgi:hypothetical protein